MATGPTYFDVTWLGTLGRVALSQKRADRLLARGKKPVLVGGSFDLDGKGTVYARGRTHVIARGEIWVKAADETTIELWDSAHVSADGSPQITAHDKAWVAASGDSRVDADGEAEVNLFERARGYVRGAVSCTVHQEAEVYAGGDAKVVLSRNNAVLKLYESAAVQPPTDVMTVNVHNHRGVPLVPRPW